MEKETQGHTGISSVLMAGVMKDGFSYVVPIRALSDKRLGDGELRLLVLYTCFANMRRHRIDALHKTLARLLNVSLRTIVYREKKLEELGYIKVKSGQRERTANIIIVNYDKGAAKSHAVPWKEKGVRKNLHTADESSMQGVAYSTTQPVAHKEDKTKEGLKEKESNDNPLAIDYGKTEEKRKTAPDLVKLFYALIDKSWSDNGFKMGVGIIQNLIERRYSVDDIEAAIRWGVKEKGMMDLTELPMKVSWFIGNRKREVAKKEKELEELDPIERGVLEDMGEI